MSTLLAITTFKKPQAADELIETLIKHNYHLNNRIILCDDSENREGKEVFEKYRKECKIAYSAGTERQGIAVNKNRGLKYFFTKTHFDDILMLDDDIFFHKEGLIDYIKMSCLDSKINYMTGYWTDENSNKEEEIKGATGRGWYSDFPIKASTSYLSWHEGCQGVLMYVERKIAEKVGFMRKYSYFYGYEHDSYMARILMADGRCPSLKPVLKHCEYWYKGQNKPNNYEIDRDIVLGKMNESGQVIEVGQQALEHGVDLQRIYQGYDLLERQHWLRKSKEVLFES